MYQAVGNLQGNAAPVWNIACGAGLPWIAPRWDDTAVMAVEDEVRKVFRDAGEPSIGERLLLFAPSSPDPFPRRASRFTMTAGCCGRTVRRNGPTG